MNCPRCQKPLVSGAPFCRHCGAPAGDGPGSVPPKAGPATMIVVGRAPGCDVVLDNPRVSRRHASLTSQADGSWLLNDLGSTNGTFLGTPLNKVRSGLVGPNDVIYFADSRFQVSKLLAKAPSPQPVRPGRPEPPPGPAPPPPGPPQPHPSIWRQVLHSWYFQPGIITVACACILFSLMDDTSLYTKVFGLYIGLMSGLFIRRLTRREKPLPVLILVGAFVFLTLETGLWNYIAVFFREVLPGREPRPGDGLLTVLIKNLFRAGLPEELFKAIPVFIGVLFFFKAPVPWNVHWGVRDSLDGIIFGVWAGIGFTLNETLLEYASNDLLLMIPRVLSDAAGHSAYAGCMGYFIGRALTARKDMTLTILKGYFLASVLHALWNTLVNVDLKLGFAVALASLLILLLLIAKARQEAGIPVSR